MKNEHAKSGGRQKEVKRERKRRKRRTKNTKNINMRNGEVMKETREQELNYHEQNTRG